MRTTGIYDTLIPFVAEAIEDLNGTTINIDVEVEVKLVGGGTGTIPARIFQQTIRGVFGSLPMGVVAVRFIAGTDTWSQHAYGNAVDVMTGGNSDLRHDIVYFAHANRGVLSIAHLLADPWFPSPRRDHYNHVHVDFFPQWCGTPPGHVCG